MPPIARKQFEEIFRFEPEPMVRRVIYIATPHGGSLAAQSPIGKVARRLVALPEQVQQTYRGFQASNSNLPARIPNSIDHLMPGNSVLESIATFPVSRGVQSHSIIGAGHMTPPLSEGDGLVTVGSARVSGVASELLVLERHMDVHRSTETIGEVKRILRLHAAQNLR
ncbi:MAG: hypothetical protein AAGA03_12915 [Planctomycetota bacterium]